MLVGLLKFCFRVIININNCYVMSELKIIEKGL
jgi:hypothetical protein